MTPNKMQGHFWHLFLTQFFILLHMVTYILFSMAAQITAYFKESDWLLNNFQQSERAKPRVPCERASKTVSETGVKSDPAFCLGPTIKKTNSASTRLVRCFLNYRDTRTPSGVLREARGSQDTVNDNWSKPWLCVCWKCPFLQRSLIIKTLRG